MGTPPTAADHRRAAARAGVVRPRPLRTQLAFAAWVYGVAMPAVRLLTRVGRAGSKLAWVMRRRERAVAARDPFRGYVPGPQDVFVATYPKSGTNWMLQIVHQLLHHGRGAFEHVHDVVPWPDTRAGPWFLRAHAIPLSRAVGWRDAPERRRVIKTHLPADLVPYAAAARYVVVIRDPKDVLVSSYHFVRDAVLGPAMPSVEAWYRMFLNGSSLGGSWGVHAAGWWARRHRPNVKLVAFKAMKRDLPGTVRSMAGFLGVEVSEEVLAAVVAQASFEHMKRIDAKFHLGPLLPWRPPGAMLRRGAQGGAAELLTREQQRRARRAGRGRDAGPRVRLPLRRVRRPGVAVGGAPPRPGREARPRRDATPGGPGRAPARGACAAGGARPGRGRVPASNVPAVPCLRSLVPWLKSPPSTRARACCCPWAARCAGSCSGTSGRATGAAGSR